MLSYRRQLPKELWYDLVILSFDIALCINLININNKKDYAGLTSLGVDKLIISKKLQLISIQSITIIIESSSSGEQYPALL